MMDKHDVSVRKAIATSAARDAENREEFFDEAEPVLGVRPVLISGAAEGRYAFSGATGGGPAPQDVVVSDIGGGSTEFVTRDQMFSIDIGSVRLTERALPDRPASTGQLAAARGAVIDLFGPIDIAAGSVIGVAGTWTSLAAMAQNLERYDRARVHGFEISGDRLSELTSELASLTIRQTEAIPALDPKRAPVILAGAVVAECVLTILGLDRARVSERDTLDGVAGELLALL